MARLSVNVNKVATLRNSRGGKIPDLCKVTLDCERFGAQGITMHPRPDERHIRFQDVRDISPLLKTELNIEGYPSEALLDLVSEVKPTQVTLVPDPPHVLTSDAGWLVKKNESFLRTVVHKLKETTTRVSLFIDPVTVQAFEFSLMREMGVDRVELYTESYARYFPTKDRERITLGYVEAAKSAKDVGLGVNAGHDLNTENLNFLIRAIPFIEEVSIGHALIADALYWGLEETIQRYLSCLKS